MCCTLTSNQPCLGHHVYSHKNPLSSLWLLETDFRTEQSAVTIVLNTDSLFEPQQVVFTTSTCRHALRRCSLIGRCHNQQLRVVSNEVAGECRTGRDRFQHRCLRRQWVCHMVSARALLCLYVLSQKLFRIFTVCSNFL